MFGGFGVLYSYHPFLQVVNSAWSVHGARGAQSARTTAPYHPPPLSPPNIWGEISQPCRHAGPPYLGNGSQIQIKTTQTDFHQMHIVLRVTY